MKTKYDLQYFAEIVFLTTVLTHSVNDNLLVQLKRTLNFLKTKK